MIQYIDLVKTTLTHGVHKPNRTGVDTKSYFCYPFRHDLADGFPLLTTKKMDGPLWNSIVHELLWFISGENHIRNFQKKSKIWNAWADKQGNLETAYGWYWRHFPHTGGTMTYYGKDDGNSRDYNPEELDDEVGNFDQLAWCVEQLKTNPNSRRMVVSAWEPYNAHKSKLPPCHLLYIFNVQDGRLCLHLTQRSCDIGLGVPFNIASYALLTHIVAKEVGLQPGILSIMFVDAHIYIAETDDTVDVNGSPRSEYDHSRMLLQQIERKPFSLPSIQIADKKMEDLEFEDFSLVNYKSHGKLNMKVAV